jgi:hypothetical protein
VRGGIWYLFSYLILYAETKCVSVETNRVSVKKNAHALLMTFECDDAEPFGVERRRLELSTPVGCVFASVA